MSLARHLFPFSEFRRAPDTDALAADDKGMVQVINMVFQNEIELFQSNLERDIFQSEEDNPAM